MASRFQLLQLTARPLRSLPWRRTSVGVSFPSHAVCGILAFKYIVKRPHAYNSRRSEIVRHFLLEQLVLYGVIPEDHDLSTLLKMTSTANECGIPGL